MENLDLIKKLEKFHFNAQINLYLSRILKYDNYDICFSDLIDDSYWNFAINMKAKTKEGFYKDLEKLNKIFKENNRKTAIYISPASPLYDIREDLGLTKEYTDSWMILEKLSEFPEYKSKLDININKVNNDGIKEFVKAVMTGFASDDINDPYGELSNGYKIALENSFLNKEKSEYKVNHYIANYNKENVGTATAIYNGNMTFIYNVTTKKEYKRNGICKELMSYMIKDLYNNKNIKLVCLQTETGFYTENVYLNMGFKKIFEGTGYNGDRKI